MANCTLCGQSGHEVVGHRGDANAGNFHRDCAYLAYQLSVAHISPIPDMRKQVQLRIDHLVRKRQSILTDFP